MNQRDQKIENRRRVLSAIRRNPGVSQAQLAVALNLRPSTVSYVTRKLKELGLVRVIDRGTSGREGGKPAELLSLDPDTGTFGGLYIRRNDLIVSAIDYSEKMLETTRAPVEGLGKDEILSKIIHSIEGQHEKYRNYKGVGIAASSVVSRKGSVIPSAHFDYTIPNFLETLTRHFPEIACVVENDANCCVVHNSAHAKSGAENLAHLVLYSSPGTMGAGIITGGKLYRGSYGAAGEIFENNRSGTEPFSHRAVSMIRMIFQLIDPDRLEYTCDEKKTVREVESELDSVLNGEERPRICYSGGNDKAVLGASLSAMQRFTDTILNE